MSMRHKRSDTAPTGTGAKTKRDTSPLGNAAIGNTAIGAASSATSAQREDPSSVRESSALREELKQFALMLDLRPKRRPRATQADVVPVFQPSLTFRQIAQRLAPFVVAIGVLSATAALRAPAPPVLPPALMGAWVTSHKSYAGTEIGFVDAEISFRLGRTAELQRYPVTSMKSHVRSDTTRLTLSYKTENGPVELNLRLVDGIRPELIFDRPEGLSWHHPRRGE